MFSSSSFTRDKQRSLTPLMYPHLETCQKYIKVYQKCNQERVVRLGRDFVIRLGSDGTKNGQHENVVLREGYKAPLIA